MTKARDNVKILPRSPFSGFSRFGGQKNILAPKSSNQPAGEARKRVLGRPQFITQHKGGS